MERRLIPITIRCPECTQILKVADKLAGRRGKCPKCGVLLEIPIPREPAGEAPPRSAPRPARSSEAAITREQTRPSRRRAADEEDDDDLSEEEARPRGKRKKRRKSPLLLISLLAAGLGLLLCSGAGGLAWWYLAASSIDDDLKYMPNNCQVVMSIRAEQLMQSEVYKELQREAPDVDKGKADFSKEIGLSADEVEQAVVGVGANPKDTVVVVRTRKAVEAKDLRSRIQNASYTENKVGKYVIQEPQRSSHPTFCVVDSKRVVYGEKEAVRAVPARDKKPDFSRNLEEALKQVDFSKTLVVAADVQSSRKQAGDAFRMFGGDQGALSSLEKTTALVVQAKVASDVRLELVLLCRDAAAANNVKKLIDSFLVMGRDSKIVPKEVGDLLELNLKVDGNKMTGSNTFKVGPLIKLYKQNKRPF